MRTPLRPRGKTCILLQGACDLVVHRIDRESPGPQPATHISSNFLSTFPGLLFLGRQRAMIWQPAKSGAIQRRLDHGILSMVVPHVLEMFCELLRGALL